QERDRNRERDDGRGGGRIERRCHQEWLHHVHSDEDQATVDEPFCLSPSCFDSPVSASAVTRSASAIARSAADIAGLWGVRSVSSAARSCSCSESSFTGHPLHPG